MPLRATDNPLVLPLLGLLLEQPRHQYALLSALRERYRHLGVHTGSVYTLVRSLQEAEWIEAAEPQSATGEKSPVAYRLTSEGIGQFRSKVVAGLEDADAAHAMTFITALAYVGILDRTTAITTLRKRIDALRQRATELEEAVDAAGIAAVHMIEVAFYASQTRHDIVWLQHFATQIAEPDYAWPIDSIGEP